MTPLPKKELLRPDEVASYFRVSRSSVYRWIDEGKLDSMKTPGQSVRIPREAVAKVVEREE